jgi:hypothetical protein
VPSLEAKSESVFVAYSNAVTRYEQPRGHASARRERGSNPVQSRAPAPPVVITAMPALGRHPSSSSILSMATTASTDTAVSDSASTGEVHTRKRPTPAQLDALQTVFDDKPYLTRGERIALADSIGMCVIYDSSPRCVQLLMIFSQGTQGRHGLVSKPATGRQTRFGREETCAYRLI